MVKESNRPLIDAALNMTAILGVIMKMSDDVANARTPLDQQGKLLFMQHCIQKNAGRMMAYAKLIHDTAAKARG